MPDLVLHFLIGSAGALGVFLIFAWLSGEKRFSAPFGVFFVGFSCALLAHYLSPWATPAVLTAYGMAAFQEYRNFRKAVRQLQAHGAAPD